NSGEPYVRKVPVRFGGRGGSRPSLPLYARSRKCREATLVRADGVARSASPIGRSLKKRSAKSLGLKSFAELTTPSAALRRLRAFLLMPQLPLLFKEGNVSALKQSVNSFTRSDALGQNPGNRLINMLTTIFTFTLLLAQHAFTPDEIAEGGRLYQSNCASCHGSAGDQVPGVALMSGKFGRATTDEDVARIIRNGIPGTAMQSFTFSEQQAGTIVAYLKSISGSAP